MFVTTGTLTSGAREATGQLRSERVALIDGPRLADLRKRTGSGTGRRTWQSWMPWTWACQRTRLRSL